MPQTWIGNDRHELHDNIVVSVSDKHYGLVVIDMNYMIFFFWGEGNFRVGECDMNCMID